MSFAVFILVGLLLGVIAKLMIPGRRRGGWIAPILLGIVGALLGGWFGSAVFAVDLEQLFAIETWTFAIGGAVIALLIWVGIFGRTKSS
ncbi:GlsB/YeaQ/YmgE family stress response membrane protein [Humidisolicoccus flavus]|uniref:GlsB/YeaQ/YmgE family stress response membrane protein n=1 Tax=Humidisolicoccus flavus TaxID=3111414 RepID=UPI00324D0EBD